MPYDPRPVSQGGNRGMDEEFFPEAVAGKFKVVGVDTFDGADWVVGKYATLEEAKKKAIGGEMLKHYVYDSAGKCVHSAGRF